MNHLILNQIRNCGADKGEVVYGRVNRHCEQCGGQGEH
jgi:hypothetical protein